MGPSGSGKSTSMNMVGCLDVPTKGSIYLDGKNISRMTEIRSCADKGKEIGFIFQQFNLIQTLTALENVALPMIFQKTRQSEERTRKAEKQRASSLRWWVLATGLTQAF